MSAKFCSPNVVLGVTGRYPFPLHRYLHLYDLVLFPLAIAAAYPDRLVVWIAEQFGKTGNWLHVIAVEIFILGLIALAMRWLRPSYPNLAWWFPLVCIGLAAIFRGLKRFLTDQLGFGDD